MEMATRRERTERDEVEEMEDIVVLDAPTGMGLDVLPTLVRGQRRLWKRTDSEEKYTPNEFWKRFR